MKDTRITLWRDNGHQLWRAECLAPSGLVQAFGDTPEEASELLKEALQYAQTPKRGKALIAERLEEAKLRRVRSRLDVSLHEDAKA